MRYRFNEIFKETDGSISPVQRIRVGGVTIGSELTMRAGVAIGGVDFLQPQFKGHDIEADTDGDVLVIKGIYE
ncbi:MAG: hypothetical protein Q7S48_03565 [bacterium]|nr:hypothetical protein [bacterium]